MMHCAVQVINILHASLISHTNFISRNSVYVSVSISEVKGIFELWPLKGSYPESEMKLIT